MKFYDVDRYMENEANAAQELKAQEDTDVLFTRDGMIDSSRDIRISFPVTSFFAEHHFVEIRSTKNGSVVAILTLGQDYMLEGEDIALKSPYFAYSYIRLFNTKTVRLLYGNQLWIYCHVARMALCASYLNTLHNEYSMMNKKVTAIYKKSIEDVELFLHNKLDKKDSAYNSERLAGYSADVYLQKISDGDDTVRAHIDMHVHDSTAHGLDTLHYDNNVAHANMRTEIQQCQTDIENAVTTVSKIITQMLPVGTILDFDGSIDDIPVGWAVCDGREYKLLDGTCIVTLDLRDTFIMGRSISDSSSFGGKNKWKMHMDQLPKHNHAAGFNRLYTNGYTKLDTKFEMDYKLDDTCLLVEAKEVPIPHRIGKSPYGDFEVNEYKRPLDPIYAQSYNMGIGASIDNRPQYYTVIKIRRYE